MRINISDKGRSVSFVRRDAPAQFITREEESTDVTPHWYSGNPRVAAIGNHLYDAGITFDSNRFFERLKITLDNARREADSKDKLNLFPTSSLPCLFLAFSCSVCVRVTHFRLCSPRLSVLQ